jgi:hypothetical protein
VLVGPVAFEMFCNTDIACSPAVATSASGHQRRFARASVTSGLGPEGDINLLARVDFTRPLFPVNSLYAHL